MQNLCYPPISPIQTAADDKLNRKTFSQAFAKALAGFSSEDSFVVGIHGKWGTGKSSILNLLVEQIGKDNEGKADTDKLHVMRFNPWNFSDQNQLVFQFLRQFRAHLKGNQKEFKDLLASLDDYAEALAPPLELLPYGHLFSSGMKVGVKGAQKLFGAAKDVNSLFDQIAVKARKLKLRTVVLIDDIDRLTAVETMYWHLIERQYRRLLTSWELIRVTSTWRRLSRCLLTFHQFRKRASRRLSRPPLMIY